ncbi:MAG: protein translocase subunit SecF [Clostridia bacterium]|nr:protein translocase subunit SecF [Clostridia bacterium]
MKNFDFVAKRKIFSIVSVAILLVGLIFNIIFGTKMDISFTGGTELPYSYTGELTQEAVEKVVHDELPESTVTVGDGSIMITLTDAVELDTISAVEEALEKAFADNKITVSGERRSLQASYGRTFFVKCLVAIALASLLVVLYVGLRFRNIGGVSAAVLALAALLHDILIAYFVFVIFRIPLNDNFVAVILAILGYSLNDAIVIYDRIRENRKKMDKKTPITEIVNLSLSQSFTRTLNTSVCTLIAIGTVAVVALITGMDSIVSFALPMSVGVIAGFYSTTFLCTPLWAVWVEYSESKKPAKKAKKR